MDNTDNKQTTAKAVKKPLNDTDKMVKSLSKIKLLKPIPLTDTGKKLPLVVHVHKTGSGFSGATTVKVSYSLNELEIDPIGMIKKEPILAKHTNATKEQIEFILKSPINKLQSNG